MPRGTTAYNRVATVLREQILTGKLSPGEKLPPEYDLCEQFSTSSITIRRAVGIIAEEMLVRREQGRGTFVAEVPTRKIPLMEGQWAASIARHAPDITRRLERIERRAADHELAGQLNTIAGEPVVFARRIDSLKGKPSTMDEVWLVERYANKLKESDYMRLDFVERWPRVQRISISYCEQYVEAVPAQPATSKLLKVKRGAPLLKETDIVHLDTDEVAAVFVSHYRHDAFRLAARVRFS